MGPLDKLYHFLNVPFRAMLRMSYSDHFPCVCPLTFSNDFSSEAPEAILLKFHLEPP